MTRERAKELLPVFQAYAEGRTIQVQHDDIWRDVTECYFYDNTPYFYDCTKYRIKPEPRTWWILVPKDPEDMSWAFDTLEKANNAVPCYRHGSAILQIVKAIEVE